MNGRFKFDFSKKQAAAPSYGGSVDLPTGQENCLAGLNFVFTGILESLNREDGISLVKKYGGYVNLSLFAKQKLIFAKKCYNRSFQENQFCSFGQ